MILSIRRIAFCCFILSGMASVSYQMIWLRQAMTYFGVITPVNSAVLSVFMLGLALGTVLAGKITARISRKTALIYYAIVEGLVALFALMVPFLFKAGYWLLLDLHSPQSASYLFFSCIIITLILMPVCTLIGATLPLLMRYLEDGSQKEENFSFLYYANLLGALLGCIAPVILIEVMGFSGSLELTASLNVMAALLAICGLYAPQQNTRVTEEYSRRDSTAALPVPYLIILFVFGFVTLGSEVIWIKAFMPVVMPTVYSFAYILGVYLICNASGTQIYRITLRYHTFQRVIIFLLPVSALLPIMGISLSAFTMLKGLAVLSIAFLCFCLGYITPKIIDDICQNNPKKASVAYTFNCIGCIVGPLFSTYVLFPQVGLKYSLILYACLLLFASLFMLRVKRIFQLSMFFAFGILLLAALKAPDMEDYIQANGALVRDHVGYIGATGQGMNKRLLINGIGMTGLITITKNMAYLPLLHHPHPKSALVICFGMGTTVRSLTNWPLESITAVELSKGVTELFGYFHQDAARVWNDPRVNIVIDDGRRFLNRSGEQYDIVILDPPPPVEAAGSGLLYTTEFLDAVKSHLAAGGILQHWIPGSGDQTFIIAALRSIKMRFRYVKIYASLEDDWGIHILASDTPLPELTATDFVNHLPAKAAEDLKEWKQGKTIDQIAQDSLHLVKEESIFLPELDHIYMSDDRLYNEFYLLRDHTLFMP